jgi:formylglycine-generating enzyme required for sulfatase activity
MEITPTNDKNSTVSLRGWFNKRTLALTVGILSVLISATACTSSEEAPKVAETIPTAGEQKKNGIGMEFVWIPAGEFMMGSTEADIDEVAKECKEAYSECVYDRAAASDELPQRKVVLSNGFWIGRFEVTQGQYKELMGKNPSRFDACGDNCPVEQVSWSDAQEFIKKLNEKNDGFVYSLPTEAEWEYATRAGTTGIRYGELDEIAWYGENSGDAPFDATRIWRGEGIESWMEKAKANNNRTHPVGTKKPNAWGLYDTNGNVWEWVEDIYNKDGYAGLSTDGTANTVKGDASKRVLRGGSWSYISNCIRSAGRRNAAPDLRDDYSGFRVVAKPAKTN